MFQEKKLTKGKILESLKTPGKTCTSTFAVNKKDSSFDKKPFRGQPLSIFFCFGILKFPSQHLDLCDFVFGLEYKILFLMQKRK